MADTQERSSRFISLAIWNPTAGAAQEDAVQPLPGGKRMGTKKKEKGSNSWPRSVSSFSSMNGPPTGDVRTKPRVWLGWPDISKERERHKQASKLAAMRRGWKKQQPAGSSTGE